MKFFRPIVAAGALFLLTSTASALNERQRTDLSVAYALIARVADNVGDRAKDSDERAVRRKFGNQAHSLAEEATELARKAKQGTALSTLRRQTANLEEEAKHLVELADESSDREERKALRARAVAIQGAVGKVHDKLVELERADESDSKNEARDENAPMSRESFAGLLRSLDGSSFDSGRITIVQSAAQHNHFTCAQVAAVMNKFSFDAGKQDAAVAMWPHVTDKGNSHEIFGALKFDSSRNALRARLK
jgi:hypothetical protein